MSDFTPLQALGPIAPAEQAGQALECYLDHYGLSPLLAETTDLHVGYVDTTASGCGPRSGPAGAHRHGLGRARLL